MATPSSEASNFIRDIIQDDLSAGRLQRVVTRFPPEPNGYLHIGHAKSICLNFGVAQAFSGACHLRFDDTNPTTEDVEYVESIQRDVRWLGFDWADKLFYASDYYERLYGFAVALIEAGKAYVCSLNEEEIRRYRGTAHEPGVASPYRDRSVAENLDLFARMRKGEFPDGAHVLRAKIDMASPNLKMRDWPLYRIRHAHHYRTGEAWCIYPLYDFAHCLSDLLEGITHSVCTLEFENNRELYDWIVEHTLQSVDAKTRAELAVPPHQYEFARLEVTGILTSKRKLLQLVEGKHVSGWDDPRMPTIAGLRRRGYTPEAIRAFCERVGVAKHNSTVEYALLEYVVREDLDARSPRAHAILHPLRVVIENWPKGQTLQISAPCWPDPEVRPEMRTLTMSGELFIERDDFLEAPPEDWHRLAPGREVRLRHSCIIKCEHVVKDESGAIVELHCSYDVSSLGNPEGGFPKPRKVKGTIHWVSVAHSFEAEVRLYDRLFTTDSPAASADFLKDMNPASLTTVRAQVELSQSSARGGEHIQFERIGFFFVDPVDSRPEAPVFNQTVALKDTWAKMVKADAPRTSTPAPRVVPAPAVSPQTHEAIELSPQAIALRDKHGLSADDARMLAADAATTAFFEDALTTHADAKAVARWTVNEVLRDAKDIGVDKLPFKGAAVGELVALVESATISGKLGKDVLAEMLKTGKGPRAIVEEKGLRQITDTGAIESAVDAVLAENADAVARYRGGNANLLGAFVGMVMKKTGGKANPKLVNELLKKKL